MKLVLLMYLAEDAGRVAALLGSVGIAASTRIEAEGWTKGLPSPWSGAVAPFSSELRIALVPDDRAEDVMRAVESCTECANERHPIHAVELDVARVTTSLAESNDS